ncbi:MAG: FAD-dependent thymidylate synthase [Myxococcales bacterium]|nr:FAD-dependent thymidylate synthase [Myxococcales bacterium]
MSAPSQPWVEPFTDAERARLAAYVTNTDRPVFALTNLSEVVKGALFARYSRSAKSLRRLLLDEFLTEAGQLAEVTSGAGDARGAQLYDKVFVEYGDDSVAQLGGVHLACEGASNILTKVLEWGRLAAYLEQSTRYVPYDDQPGGRFKYHVPEELAGHPLEARYAAVLDDAFETYRRWLAPMRAHLAAAHPPPDGNADRAYQSTIRAKALDALRGLLPAATRSNVGIYATGQAYENLLLRMRASPESEVRWFADLILEELRAVIPSFVQRVDREDRGVVWSRYLEGIRDATQAVAQDVLRGHEAEAVDEVSLTEFDPEGEVKVVASALYAASRLPDAQLLAIARAMSHEERARVLGAYVGERGNRRHKPGRAFERTRYRFDVLGDYGAFRDLQRHRMLTLEWQPLSPEHGYTMGEAVAAAGAEADFRRVMDETAELYRALMQAGLTSVAPYVVPMAYRVRYYMDLNARAAMHLIELRSAPQGHAAYRRVAQAMHRLIEDKAEHRAIAAAMRFVNHEAVDLERLEAERRSEARRSGGA